MVVDGRQLTVHSVKTSSSKRWKNMCVLCTPNVELLLQLKIVLFIIVCNEEKRQQKKKTHTHRRSGKSSAADMQCVLIERRGAS